MGVPITSRLAPAHLDYTMKSFPSSSFSKSKSPSSISTKKSMKEYAIILSVFALTGSTTAKLGRLCLTQGLGMTGSFLNGPWPYQIATLLINIPIYYTLLLTIGSFLGQGDYFKAIALRTWGRLLPTSWIQSPIKKEKI